MRYTQKKGDYALAKAIASFTRLGYDVLLPLTESASYDLVIEKDSKLKRIQVKYSSDKDVDLRRIHSNSKGYVIKKSKVNAYDWLYVLSSDDTEFIIKKCLHGRRSVTLNDKYKI